ncbi:MAG: DMT family transporter [Hydrogenophaga sp.]|jgi:drug/metabolite transporter (DMT)-like permease|uniref:DMT family transporter n=1 Tax=Hydrogenophaga sp. TaxID=1904254 RepID=UPI001D70E30D|nr:DMT family transporter [Hydrogenophaga sp.]MBW0170888.1 DMT family transporter [Hydrogenophaga sp.]MBW0184214.1 DMT family transporter [Hydrogenophaga sp.]
MHTLTRQQLIMLVLITLVWGTNWPIMKFGVTGFPALTFRTLCMWIGLPVLGLFLWWRRVPFRIGREHWPALVWLTVFNMLFWHTLAILAIQTLSSGRAAILGYTMPVFSALVGAWWFGQRLAGRAWIGVAAAALAVLLLLWYELTNLSGKPVGVLMMLVAAATWALGTQMMRHTRIPQPTLTISFWLTAITTVWMTVLSVVFERHAWIWPSTGIWWAIVYNAVGIFAFAQVAWLSLARELPPIASTVSVMFIPVLGVFTGAWWLGEVLHWQDWAAVALVMVAIAAVLWPPRSTAARVAAPRGG